MKSKKKEDPYIRYLKEKMAYYKLAEKSMNRYLKALSNKGGKV